MINKWIIFGYLIVTAAPAITQISLRTGPLVDSLLTTLDTTTSTYRTTQIANQLLQLIDTTRSDHRLFRIYQKKSRAQLQLGNYRTALLSQQAANRIAIQLQDSFLLGESAYRIGTIQQQQGLDQSARQHFREAIAIFSALDSTRWVAYVYNAFGILERKHEHWEAALDYYRRAYDLLQSVGQQVEAAVPLNNIGDVHLHRGQYTEALRTFRRSLDLARQQKRPDGRAIALLNIGLCLRNLEQFAAALASMHEGLALARDRGYQHTETLALRDLSETFEANGQTDSALFYLKAYLKLQEQLQQAEKNAQLEALYVAYQTQQAQNEAAAQRRQIEALKQERRLSQLTNYFVITLLMLALIVGSLFFIRNRMKRKLAEIALRNKQLEAEQIRAELEGKQKDLTNLALEIARKNETFIRANQILKEIDLPQLPTQPKQKIRELIQYNAGQLRINEDLEELLVNIEQVNADFFEKLSGIAPDLTPLEKQLCALLRLNLSTKEIASIRNISPKSVEMARYRLRKKLPIDAQDDIHTFMQQI